MVGLGLQRAVNEMSTLEGRLFVPRQRVFFRKVPGKVEYAAGVDGKKSAITPSITPLVIIENPETIEAILSGAAQPGVVGVESGRRSGLYVNSSGNLIKIKGCRVGAAFDTEGPYTVGFTPDPTKPYGGKLLEPARWEMDITAKICRILEGEGFAVPYQPIAVIGYGKKFAYHMPYESNDEQKSVLVGEELAAGVMRAEDDTRLPELYGLQVKSKSAFNEVASLLGLMAGAQHRLTESRYDMGDDSSHAYNLFVFEKQGEVWIAMMDCDSARLQPVPDKGKRIRRILDSLDLYVERIGVNGAEAPVEALNRFLERRDQFKGKFSEGFTEGYSGTTKWQPIPVELFNAAFHLPS